MSASELLMTYRKSVSDDVKTEGVPCRRELSLADIRYPGQTASGIEAA
jgi:hypothetical protein